MMIAKDLPARDWFARELFAKDLVGAQRSIRMHLVVGLAIVMVLTFGIGGWASTQEISLTATKWARWSSSMRIRSG